MSLAKPGEAGMRLGAHVIHLALAFLLAREFASGWALLPATFVFWVGLVLLSSLLDGIGRDRGGVEDTDPTTGDAAESGDAGQGMLAWPVKTPHVTLSGHDRPDDGRRQWRRHLRDVDIHFEERYRREGICTTCEFFLRAGDALALCYFPAREEDAGAGHHCDLIGPQGQRENVVVCAGAEVLLPIAQSGVHSVGIGQGESGLIGIWLVVPNAEALSLSVAVAHGSEVRFGLAEDGSHRAQIECEAPLQTRAELPYWERSRPTASAALLFMTPGGVWDEGPAPPRSKWREKFTREYRYFLKLCRGDVLTLEYVWNKAELGKMFDLGDRSESCSSARLSLVKFVREPSVMHVGAYVESGALSAVCPDDGFYTLQLELYGPAQWQERPPEAFALCRLWGEFLQRPGSVRDFELHEGWIEDWYRQRMPVPRGAAGMHGRADLRRE